MKMGIFSQQKSSTLFQSSDWHGSFGLKTCDFVTYTSKGIFIVTINISDKFWETVVATVCKFYCQQVVPS